MIKSYDKILEIERVEINKIDNLKRFCDSNNLSYQTMIRIKNRKTNRTHFKELQKFFKVFNFELESVTLYNLKTTLPPKKKGRPKKNDTDGFESIET